MQICARGAGQDDEYGCRRVLTHQAMSQIETKTAPESQRLQIRVFFSLYVALALHHTQIK